MNTTKNPFNIKQVGFGEFYYGTNETRLIAPSYASIPKEFKVQTNMTKWRIASIVWFRYGLHKDSRLIPKKGIDKEAAIKHIQCLLNCYFINLQHKIAAAAYLLSLWFEDVYMIGLQQFTLDTLDTLNK
jgi:hypothetical protein